MSDQATTALIHNPPRAAAEIRHQLADLEDVKRAAQSLGASDFASKVGLASVLAHEKELQEELHAAELLESEADAELILAGDPVVDHMIQVNFLGVVLEKVQQLVNAIAQVVSNAPTSRAAVPRNIIAENRLMLAGVFQSSFGIRLRLPTRDELGQVFEPASAEVLDSLAELLAEQAPTAKTVEIVSHARVKKHYSELLDATAKHNASIALRTRRRPFGVRLDAKQARDRVEWMDLLQMTEEELHLTGVLVGGSIESSRFELKLNDEVYRGKVSDAARKQMEMVTFGAQIHATVKATTTLHEEGVIEPTTSYLMTILVPADK